MSYICYYSYVFKIEKRSKNFILFGPTLLHDCGLSYYFIIFKLWIQHSPIYEFDIVYLLHYFLQEGRPISIMLYKESL